MTTGRGLRILVADDHPVNQRLILLQLSRLGHRADVVSDGAEAITALARAPYDVVLMDVQMPGIDGMEATRRIRQQYAGGGPAIVALTANTQPGARQACLAAGMDDYLTKPLVAEELRAALARTRTERPVLDPAELDRLRELLGDDRGALAALVDDFAGDSPALVATLLATGADQLDVDRAAHALKSLAATFGATDLARLCLQVETGVPETTDHRGLAARIATEHDRVVGALRALIGRPGG